MKPLIHTIESMGYAPYEEHMKSEAWYKMRELRKLLDNYRCTSCRIKAPLQVHHRQNFVLRVREGKARYGEEEIKDLVSLCSTCHKRKHRKWKGAKDEQETKAQRKERLRKVIKNMHKKYGVPLYSIKRTRID